MYKGVEAFAATCGCVLEGVAKARGGWHCLPWHPPPFVPDLLVRNGEKGNNGGGACPVLRCIEWKKQKVPRGDRLGGRNGALSEGSFLEAKAALSF